MCMAPALRLRPSMCGSFVALLLPARLRVIEDRWGHRNSQTTVRYTELSPDRLRGTLPDKEETWLLETMFGDDHREAVPAGEDPDREEYSAGEGMGRRDIMDHLDASIGVSHGASMMSTITPPQATPEPEPLALPAVHRFTVDEYERMADVLDISQVELINGYVVNKVSIKPPHFWSVDVLEELLRALLPVGWCLRREGPVRIPDFDEAEPDLAVARGSREDYRTRHPEPRDIALLVEVADASLDRDRGEKRAAYAKGLVPVYWIVNLIDRQVEVYSNPEPAGYRDRRVFRPGENAPVALDGVVVGEIAVAAIMP